MVRLTDLKRDVETFGTQGSAIGAGAIPDGMVRRFYKIRLQQRGATLSNVQLFGAMGATYGATYGSTIDQFKFDITNQIIEFPDGVVNENSAPIYELNRATYDSLVIRTEVASVDVFALYADEYPN